ncbi:MAG TPA: DTW domain-containing protein, partial [Smithellaceae bacterium]|nr:DTW domain-containing protein [Smithellaceae bacterium]
SARPERVVVLDATWQQARRLYSRIAVLRTLPRLVLPAPAQQRKRLRKQHRSDGMSTIEAVAAALAKLEGRETAEPLEKLYDEVVRRKNAIRWGIRQSAAEDKEIVVSSSVL